MDGACDPTTPSDRGAGAREPSDVGTQDAPAVGQSAARGAFWTILFSLANKVVALGAQVAIARLLTPAEVGVAALVSSIAMVVAPLSGTSLTNVLVQRRSTFREESGQALWLSWLLGLTAMGVMVALIPLASHLFGGEVRPLMVLSSLASLLAAFPTPYSAVLLRELRFRSLATIHFVSGLILNLGSIALATLGFGAKALIIPTVVAAFLAIAMCRRAAGPARVDPPNRQLWAGLLIPAGSLALNTWLTALTNHGSNFVLGTMHDAKTVGFYSWGMSLAAQSVYLLAANLQSILFPSFARLNADPERQVQAFRKTNTLLMVATVPLCLLQLLLARPVIELIFRDRWLPATEVVQIASVGLCTQAQFILGSSVLLARGRYDVMWRFTAVQAALSIGACALAAKVGDHVTVCIASSCVAVVANLTMGSLALAQMPGSKPRLIELLAMPIGLAVPAWLLGRWVFALTGVWPPLAAIAAVTLAVSASYSGLVLLLLPDVRTTLRGLLAARLA